MTDARISQLGRLVLRDGPAPIRVAQIARETLRDGQGPVRVAQLSRDVLLARDAPVRVSQIARLVLRSRRDSPHPNFPVRLFGPPSWSARLEGGGVSGGVSLGADDQVAQMTGGARWVVTFDETPLWSPAMVKTWRAFTAACDGGAQPCIVPFWDRRHGPFAEPAQIAPTTFGEVVWRDTPVWTDDQVTASSAATAEADARQVSFRFDGAQPASIGDHFSIYAGRFGWRLYRLVRPISTDGDVQTWEIRPPLREWLDVGVRLNFDSPRCTMRPQGDIAEVVENLRFGKGSAVFVESFGRYP